MGIEFVEIAKIAINPDFQFLSELSIW